MHLPTELSPRAVSVHGQQADGSRAVCVPLPTDKEGEQRFRRDASAR